MTDDELKAIEGRGSDTSLVSLAKEALGDRMALVAEVRRLRALVLSCHARAESLREAVFVAVENTSPDRTQGVAHRRLLADEKWCELHDDETSALGAP